MTDGGWGWLRDLEASRQRQLVVGTAETFEASRSEYVRCKPTWRSVPGGRALHAFMDGDDRPLCGVEAMVWRDHSLRWGTPRRPEHKQCAKLAHTETARRLSELFERQRREYAQEGGSDG